MRDREAYEAFLLVLFYSDLLAEIPLIQELLFLFVEGYPSLSQRLAKSEGDEYRNILSSLCIEEERLDGFFLKLWDAGVYGYPFFHNRETCRLFTGIVNNSQIPTAHLCRDDFMYFIREKFMQAKNSMSDEDWKTVLAHIYRNPMVVTEIKYRLWSLAKGKRERFMKILKEKDFPLARMKEDDWAEKISDILC